MARNGGLVGRVLQEVEGRLGYSVVGHDKLNVLEEAFEDRRVMRRELDLLAYTALDYAGGRSQDLTPEARRTLAQRARVVWMRDPMAGAATDLMNDFVFGKGVPKPKAKDPEVQKVIDDLWDDPDNQRILTSHAAQLALGTDLSLQSNLFFLLFNDGADGKVKVSLLEHDAVRNVVRDEDDRFCHLWYLAEVRREEWDFKTHAPKAVQPNLRTGNLKYYEHWQNYEARKDRAKADRTGRLATPPRPPDELIGDGKVFHVAENRTTEMTFGHPRMDRTLRWYSAYNSFMEARVDMMKAVAAIVMKRKVKGTPDQLTKQATKALSRRSDLAVDLPDFDDGRMPGPANASILNENDAVTHEALKIPSGAGEAAQDASQLRSQISAATRWPQTYYGDMSNGTMSLGTTVELPVLKGVETRAEFFEGIFRWVTDRAIERAVETGKLKKELTPEEIAAKRSEQDTGGMPSDPPPTDDLAAGGQAGTGEFSPVAEAHEDKAIDEESTQRDLGYEFSMPNPLRRALGDIIGAIMNVARTFDPNNTNVELSRTLLLVALEEMEVQDAAELVEAIFPPGYEDPAIAAAQGMAPQQPPPGDPAQQQDFGEFGPSSPPGATGADGQQHQAGNPYGAPMQSRTPEQVAQMQQAVWWPKDREGEPWPVELVEAIWARHPDDQQEIARRVEQDDLFDTVVGPVVDRALELLTPSTNGH